MALHLPGIPTKAALRNSRRLNLAVVCTALLLTVSPGSFASNRNTAANELSSAETGEYSETAKRGALSSRYLPLSVEIYINDSRVSESRSVRIRKRDGAVIAMGEDIRRWGQSVGSRFAQAAKANRWYSLQQFPQLNHRYIPESRQLFIGLSNDTTRKAAKPDDTLTETAPDSTSALASSASANGSEYDLARRNCQMISDEGLKQREVNYESLLLNVNINGVNLDSVHQFIRRPCGPLLAPILEMRQWRIKVAGQPNVLIDETNWLNLNNFDGIRYELNPESQEILLTVRPELFSSIELNFEPEYQRPTPVATGGYLNYGFSATRNSQGDMGYGVPLELGIFGPIGSLNSEWAFSRFGDASNQIRLNTTFVKDFPSDVRRLSIGDINGRPGAWGIGYRLGGIQFGSNFSIQPRLQTTPVESLELLSEKPIRLQVLNQDTGPFPTDFGYSGPFPYYDSNINSFPYGPTEITNLPTFGNGIYTARGIAADGTTIGQSQSYFYNQGLLKKGLHSYSLELGKIRQGGFSDEYETVVFSATERYGFSNRLTGEARVEYGDDVIAYGVNINSVIPWAGVLDATLAQGQPVKSSGSSRGFRSIGLSNRYRRLGYNFNFRHFDRGFIHPGEDKDKINNVRHNYTAGVSHRLPWRDNVSLGYNATSSRNADFSDSVSLSYAINSFRIASARLQFRQDIHPTTDWVAFASLSANFDSIARLFGQGRNRAAKQGRLFTPQRSNLDISASQRRDGDIQGRFRLSTRASRDQESYGLNYSAPLFGDSAYRLSGNYSNRYFTSGASVSQIDDNENYAVRVNGGIAYMGGALYLTRPIRSSFGVIDLGDDAVGVRVNGVRTNRKGKALIPNLQPYFDNRISVNLGDLPISAEVDEITTTVRPYFRSGVYIEKDIPYVTDALVQIVLEDKQGTVPLPFGAVVTLDNDPEEFPVGDDGYAYIVGLKQGSALGVIYANQRCKIDIPFPETLEPDEIPELGPFICKGVTP